MYLIVLILVTGINQILGRPNAEDAKIDLNGNSLQIPSWPLEKNVFLLPALLNSNDMINFTIHISKPVPEEIILSFMGDDYQSKVSNVICSITADIKNKNVKIFKEMNEIVTVEDQIDHFFLDDDKMLFNMWVKRRETEEFEENNVLEVKTKSYNKPFQVHNINKIRYLKLSGDNAKMINLAFEYA